MEGSEYKRSATSSGSPSGTTIAQLRQFGQERLDDRSLEVAGDDRSGAAVLEEVTQLLLGEREDSKGVRPLLRASAPKWAPRNRSFSGVMIATRSPGVTPRSCNEQAQRRADRSSSP